VTAQPTTLRDQRRETTRAWIRKAARVCFEREGAGNVSMEMVAAEAGIRRATLYLYYPGKNALLLDLLAQSLRATHRIYLQLRDLSEPNLVQVRHWLASYAAEVAEHSAAVDLFRADIHSNAELRLMLRQHIERTMSLLGERYACFDLGGIQGEARERRRFEASSMLREIEAFCADSWRDDYGLSPAAGLDILAERLTGMLVPGSGRA